MYTHIHTHIATCIFIYLDKASLWIVILDKFKTQASAKCKTFYSIDSVWFQ